MAPTSARVETPTKVTFGLAAATALTLGASALQNGHHGVQNHSTAGLPCRLAPLNGAPLRVVPVKLRSSATAVAGLARPKVSPTTASTRASDLIRGWIGVFIPSSSHVPNNPIVGSPSIGCLGRGYGHPAAAATDFGRRSEKRKTVVHHHIPLGAG